MQAVNPRVILLNLGAIFNRAAEAKTSCQLCILERSNVRPGDLTQDPEIKSLIPMFQSILQTLHPYIFLLIQLISFPSSRRKIDAVNNHVQTVFTLHIRARVWVRLGPA
jgi:hypothetical protein